MSEPGSGGSWYADLKEHKEAVHKMLLSQYVERRSFSCHPNLFNNIMMLNVL